MKNIGVIFAGGIGKRMNSRALPKQFLQLHGKEIIIYTLEHFENHNEIDGIVVVCVEGWIEYLERLLKKFDITKVKKIVSGGANGQESIYRGLCAVREIYDENCIVLIHDGVRPLIQDQTISDNIICVKKNGSAITTTSAIETIIQASSESKITEIIDRKACMLARAPQSFYLSDIIKAHENANAEGRNDFIDSASMMRYYGFSLSCVEGPVENIKITTPMDYYTFRALYEARENTQLFGI